MSDSTQDTLAHRQMVVGYATDFCSRLMDMAETSDDAIADYAADFCADIMERADRHDESKLHAPEKERFDYVGTHNHLGKCKYGSDEYKKSLEYLGPALKHHYEVNDHHPEHFEDGVDGMNLAQVVEMFCDWEAASHRNKDGNIYQSLMKNKERFALADDLFSAFRATADAFKGKADKAFKDHVDLVDLVLEWLDCRTSYVDNLYSTIEESCKDHGFSNQVYHILLNTAKTVKE